MFKVSCSVLLGDRRCVAKTHVSSINLSKILHILLDRRRRSKFGIKTRPWAGLPRNHDSIPGKGKGIFIQTAQYCCGAHLAPI